MPLLQAVATGLIALILAPGLFLYFDVTPKLAVLLAATALLLPFALPRPRRGIVFILILLYACSLILSASLSTNPGLSWFGSNWRRYGAITQIALFLFAYIASTPSHHRLVLRGIVISTAIASLYGVAQFAGFDPLLPSTAYHVGEGVWTIVRPPSTLGYVSYFATWLAVAVFLAGILAAREKGVWRHVARVTIGFACSALVLTGSRAAWLGLAAGAVVWIFRSGGRVPRRAALIAAGALAGVAALYISPAGQPLRSRTRWFVEDPWGGARPTLWRDSFVMGLSRPLAGFGPETFTAQFPRHESIRLAQAYPDFAHESPHNIFLDALVSQGLPGLLLLAALTIAGLAAAFRSPHPGLSAALTAGLVSQQFTVFTIPTALITFLAVALAFEAAPPFRARWTTIAFAPIALALFYCAVRYTLADSALAQTQRDLGSGNLRAASEHYRRYSSLRFPGTAADLWYSRSLYEFARRTSDANTRIQAIVQSGVAGMQATGTAEDPFDAWYNLAQLSATRNDAAGAERALRSAIAAHPNWFKPHWTLAQLLVLLGRGPEASAEAALAVQLDAGKHPEVQQTLAPILKPAAFQR